MVLAISLLRSGTQKPRNLPRSTAVCAAPHAAQGMHIWIAFLFKTFQPLHKTAVRRDELLTTTYPLVCEHYTVYFLMALLLVTT